MSPTPSVICLVSVHLICSALAAGCGGNNAVSPTSPTTLESKPSTSGLSAATVPDAIPDVIPDEVFVGAGDIARCGVGDAEATAKLLDRIPGTVFTLGDNVQDVGADAEYANCFEPTWGRHRSRMLPTVGNHDWFGGHGRPYFSYFGASAGPAGLGYYSQTVGAWHVISLNSEIPAGPGSPQDRVAEGRPGGLARGLHARDVAPAAVHLGAQRPCRAHARRVAAARPLRRRTGPQRP